jgi:acyl-homoserine-lactone acylase
MRKIILAGFILFLSVKAQSQSFIDPNLIDIVRDSFGVPHIFAKTDPEVAYGLAWAEAEDDFKSMQIVVLPAKGLMGKVLGKEGAAGDYAFALFRCKEITEEKWNTLSPAFIRLINGYTQGFNDYAKTHPEEVLKKGIFPVTTKDYIASSVLALTVFNGADDALRRIFSNTIWTLPEMDKKGSNAIAVHPSKTTTGEAFLVINAHQPNTGPQAFYEAHVCSEEGWNALGGLLAGGTSILHGVNENLGWAHTVNYCDRVDVYQLEMNPGHLLQYKFDGQWLTLEKKTIKLKIKGLPVTIKRSVYWSRYGATMKNKQGFFSIRLGANMEIRALEQWYEMNKARNFTEFYSIISTPGLSMFNITYADKYDTIFYIDNALMPVRDTAAVYDWKRTLPGNTSKTLWTQFRSIGELPKYINPKSGFLFNTNHSPFLATGPDDDLKPSLFPKTDGWETWQNNRSARVFELMPPNNKLSYEELKKIKFDTQLPQQLRYPYGIDSMYLLNPADYPEYAALINEFKAWNKRGDADSKGAAIFLLTYLHLAKQLAGQDARQITRSEAIATYKAVKEYMMKYFGTTSLVLGDIQKLVRGEKEYPLSGLQDVLAAQWTDKYKNGKLKSTGGDGYIAFVRFPKQGLPLIETVNMYGASSKPGSKHFDDQVPLYLQQKTKKMTLDKGEVYRTAERIYHPQ